MVTLTIANASESLDTSPTGGLALALLLTFCPEHVFCPARVFVCHTSSGLRCP